MISRSRSSPSSGRNGSSKDQRRRRGKQARVAARGRRFSPEDHERALSLIAAGMKRAEVAKTVGCTTESLRRWYQEAKQKGLVTVRGKAAGARPTASATDAPPPP